MVKKSAETMQQARVAIRKGDFSKARRLLRQLVRDDPENHAAWLLLARVTPSLEAAAEYVKRAEALQPNSELVQQARSNLEQQTNVTAVPPTRHRLRNAMVISGFALFFAVAVVALGPHAWEQVLALQGEPVVETPSLPTATPTTIVIAQVDQEPEPISDLLPTPTARPTLTAVEATKVAAIRAEEAAKELLEQTQTREAEIFDPEEADGSRPRGVSAQDRWIDVDLGTQMLVAYEGDTPVYNTLISSGTEEYPTITGQYRTYMKYESQDMDGYAIGYDYYLQDVPYVMYFSGNFAIHGADWHWNFGVPSSHGCVNVNTVDAGWLFNWAPVGTTVNIHN